MQRRVVAFYQDEEQHWAARLTVGMDSMCGTIRLGWCANG